MENTITLNQKISLELGLNDWQVENVIQLLSGDATIPFISRYRKEMTGSLDEVVLTTIRDRQEQLLELEKRRAYILKTIGDQGNLTPELKNSIIEAETMALLEDLYLPYKPKRRTKATIAREKGLEPLARLLYEQKNIDVENAATAYINPDKQVKDIDEALAGARDILAEWISEDAGIREMLRKMFYHQGNLTSKVIRGKETEGVKYKDYYDFSEAIKKIPSHRMLAIRRGEKETFLSVDIQPDEIMVHQRLGKMLITGRNASAEQVEVAFHDAYKRLLKPSMENEVRVETKKSADAEAISVFAENLRQLLLSPSLGQKRVLALDPGFRTGCKLVCLDEQGKLLFHTAVFPNEPQRKVEESASVIRKLVDTYRIEAVAIGNGTAGRETETFVRSLNLPPEIVIVMVNESGASVYSASEVAREEFPNEDVTVRGAVSIGRRLMDPLAELVKIDPKSIGVGQYQHDVDQGALKKSLDDVVVSCVNAVGVELNTASREILAYVSGLGPQLAANIVEYRNENGPFLSRENLKKVPRMGGKAFEQCAGFLRIRGGNNPLDGSAVHPERYDLVKKMAADLGCTVKEMLDDPKLRERIRLRDYVTGDVGLPTLEDIMNEMNKPGRDPRKSFEVFEFSKGIMDISDLRQGMVLPGIVTNITKFGAFVDVGVHQDGLVHVSQLADRFVSDPAEVVKISQQVTVRVVEVDAARKRISLSMKKEEKPTGKPGSKPDKKPDKHSAGGDMKSKLEALRGKFK
jgi:protein Tex